MTIDTLILLAGAGLFLGLASGFVMHRADFCLAGMFRDLFLFGSAFKLRMLLLLVVSSMLLFEVARQCGVLPLYPFPLLGPASLMNLIGGFFFGIGMVLAGGCVVGTLYKLGSGSALSAIALAGLVAGSALYAEIHPWVVAVSRSTTIFPGHTTLPQLLGADPLAPVMLLALPCLALFMRWHREGAWQRPGLADGYLQPWRAALLLSLIGLASYAVVGMPLGITTSYAKAAGFVESVFFSEHLKGLAYFQVIPLNYRHPITGAQLAGGPAPVPDAIAAIQFPVIAGILLGSALSAARLKELRFRASIPWRQCLSAAVGGIVMGVASRVAPGCNVWHLMGGLPILSLQSILFVAGLFPGAFVGSRLLCRLVVI